MEPEIARETFEHLCALQCPEKEMADWFGCTPAALRKWCKQTYNMDARRIYAKMQARGRVQLREQALALAEKNASMMSLLLKSCLGLGEKPETGAQEGGGVVVYVPQMLTEEECTFGTGDA
mgnify:CR=1 FL=1